MRHHNHNRKFGRPARQRKALLRSLSLSLIQHEKITTTEAKAKEIRPVIEKLVTRARANKVSDRRLIVSRLGGAKSSSKKLIETIATRYSERNGGYTRITKLNPRNSDGARMAIIEFV